MIPAHPFNILVAEDDFLVSREIERAVTACGYTIIGTASNGIDVIEQVKELRPDVVLMDIHMPRQDGLLAARLIQEQCPTPIVVLTAHESQDLVDKASRSGVGAYLTKPPKKEEIERAVTIAVARHRDLMALKQLSDQLEKTNRELEASLSEVQRLRGIIPICASCKKIRNDNGYWEQVEEYIRDHSQAEFSHGICPDCAEKIYGEYLRSKHPRPDTE